jgi:ADP-heptose:LPS heptosyltransferase
MKILLIKLGALGDVINTFPLVVNLKKHFNAEIDWPGCALELSPCCHPPLCG